MEEARRVLERLERIEELERERASSPEVLGELRELVREAEEWLRAEEGPHGAAEALARCREALAAEDEEVAVLAH
jgi:hypothetical protein